MIKSILEKHPNRIILDHIIDEDGYHSDPEEIKQIANVKAKQWTKKRNINQSEFNQWHNQYQPKSNIQDHIFNNISNPINESEMSQTL